MLEKLGQGPELPKSWARIIIILGGHQLLVSTKVITSSVDYVMVDPQQNQKIWKRHFFADIQNSF